MFVKTSIYFSEIAFSLLIYFLNCRRGTGAFYCHVAVPIAEQLVVFSEGDWEELKKEYEVTLTYKDDEIVLGKITRANK